MIQFDFNTYMDRFIDKDMMGDLLAKRGEVYDKFSNSRMTGWTRRVEENLISDIIKTRDFIKECSNCLVIVGIGGSFLGSYALKEMFSKYFNDSSFEIIYAGCDLSSNYLAELIEYLKDKDFCINVISKSGTTMETTISYEALKNLMMSKYSADEMNRRIIVTTDAVRGKLREEVNENNYKSFIIPDDIGGRYSLFTVAHLLPLSFVLDIRLLLDGFYGGLNLRDEAYYYSCVRRCLFDRKKYIENFCVYDKKLYYYTEWLKQLFGETEGKDGKGIFPVSTVHTRDLHSLGQFIQEGNPIIFETFIKILESKDYYVSGKNLADINNIVLDSVMEAHYSGGVPCSSISVSRIDEENIGVLCAFFMMSAAFSGYLFGVDPFNQPGVEVYKKFIRDNLSNN